jgi:hypothetical protein
VVGSGGFFAGITYDEEHHRIGLMEVGGAARETETFGASTLVQDDAERAATAGADALQFSTEPGLELGQGALRSGRSALPLGELAEAGDIYAYSFSCTNIGVLTSGKAVVVECWCRQRSATREHLLGQQARCGTRPRPASEILARLWKLPATH